VHFPCTLTLPLCACGGLYLRQRLGSSESGRLTYVRTWSTAARRWMTQDDHCTVRPAGGRSPSREWRCRFLSLIGGMPGSNCSGLTRVADELGLTRVGLRMKLVRLGLG